MRGIPESNFPAFHAEAARLRDLGYEVISPAEMDLAAGDDPVGNPQPISYYMKRDLPAVCDCDAVVLLPGWEDSEGCKIELAVAVALRKPVLDAGTLEILS